MGCCSSKSTQQQETLACPPLPPKLFLFFFIITTTSPHDRPDSPLVTVASSTLPSTITLAHSSLESLYHQLPTTTRAVLERIVASLHDLAHPYVSYLPAPIAASFSKTAPESVNLAPYALSIILSSLIVLLALAMSSSWRSFLDPGHLSPYFRLSPTAPAPTVTNDDYHYLGPDDIVDPPRPRPSYNPGDNYFHGGSRADAENPDSPDILVCRHQSTTYPLHFPAFCIGEGVLRVSELRKRVAKELRARSPRHVTLYYKAKELKDDAVACREEGLKQNSEIMCVLSETAASGSGAHDSGESADEEDIRRAEREREDRAADGQQGKKRKGHRAGKKGKKGTGQSDNHSTSDTTTNTTTTTPRSSTPQPPQPLPVPTTPMEKLNLLVAQFREHWQPQCRKLMARPPSEAKARDFEYKKLSEALLTQILMKADDVQSEGNDDARAKRKAIVKEAQALLNEMDAWMKK